MSGKEHLPEFLSEELNDTEQALLSLAPRASRIDRDRLMIALGKQSAARSATPWKWATGASLMLALALGVRPAFDEQTAELQPIVKQQDAGDARSVVAEESPALAESPQIQTPDRWPRDEFDWLRALASGRFDSSRPLTVRPELGASGTTLRSAEVAVRDETEETRPAHRQPMLRWGDERLRQGEAEMFVPRT